MTRPTFVNLLAAGVGIGAAVVILALSMTFSPRAPPESVAVASSGTSFAVPPYENTTDQNGGPAACGEHHDCGFPGLASVSFALATSYHLSGVLHSSASVELEVYNAATPACGWGEPQANCTTELGYRDFGATFEGTFDVGSLQFNLSAGDWTMSLANYSNSPVTVMVVQTLAATRA